MKKARLIFLFIFLVLPLSGCSAQPRNIREKSEAVEAQYTWDFGRVKAGEILKHTFILKNETSRVMNIKEVHTSCGCTALEVKKKKLLPQESTSIEVTFNSKGYSEQTSQYVYVHTDNLDNPIIRYIIKAEVVK